MDFKKFVQEKVQYCINHFRKNAVLLDQNGEQLLEVDFSFDALSD